jgi:hypothetical protein
MDPESVKDRRMPTNFDSRPSFARPNNHNHQNRQRPPHISAGAGAGADGKWQRGHEARPDFQKQRQNLDADLDSYGTKSQKAGGAGNAEFDDWRKGRGEGKSLSERIGGRDRSRSPRRSRSPPRREEMRPSPPRGGDRRSEESDMVLDDE